jgi:hypothetical protein
MVHLTHPIGRGCRQCVQKSGRRDHVLAGPGETGQLPLCTINHQGLARLKHQFMSVQVCQSSLNDHPLISKLPLSLCNFMFDVVL